MAKIYEKKLCVPPVVHNVYKTNGSKIYVVYHRWSRAKKHFSVLPRLQTRAKIT